MCIFTVRKHEIHWEPSFHLAIVLGSHSKILSNCTYLKYLNLIIKNSCLMYQVVLKKRDTRIKYRALHIRLCIAGSKHGWKRGLITVELCELVISNHMDLRYGFMPGREIFGLVIFWLMNVRLKTKHYNQSKLEYTLLSKETHEQKRNQSTPCRFIQNLQQRMWGLQHQNLRPLQPWQRWRFTSGILTGLPGHTLPNLPSKRKEAISNSNPYQTTRVEKMLKMKF